MSTLWPVVIANIPLTIIALATLISSIYNGKNTTRRADAIDANAHSLAKTIDGQQDALVAIHEKVARAEGKIEGAADEKKRNQQL